MSENILTNTLIFQKKVPLHLPFLLGRVIITAGVSADRPAILNIQLDKVDSYYVY